MDKAKALERARVLASCGEDEAAKAVYFEILTVDSKHFDALTELAALAGASGHRSAARTAYTQAAQWHPGNKIGRVNLGNALMEDGEWLLARMHYAAALEVDADFPEAHQGMARVLAELGKPAEEHWRRGFVGHAVNQRRYRGKGAGVQLLLLGSAYGGNVPTQRWIDDRVFAVTAVYTEFYDPAAPLPPHRMVVNAIGDADLCGAALARAEHILAATTAPVINPPALVRVTGRAENAKRLAGLPGVIAPRMVQAPLAVLAADETLGFPLLLRAPGFHTGQHFVRVEERSALAAAAADLAKDELLAIEYLDARGADGLSRKYRVMSIDGTLYPLHLAISRDWKVHYFSAAMADDDAYRAEEQRFLEDMPGVLGARAMDALAGIVEVLGLDYCGVDFALAADGHVLLFEANATMVINPPDADPIWAYRRMPLARAVSAARWMLLRRIDEAGAASSILAGA